MRMMKRYRIMALVAAAALALLVFGLAWAAAMPSDLTAALNIE